MTSILVRGARQLVTLRGPSGPRRGAALRELGIIQDGAFLIRDGLVADVGQGRRVENLAEAREAQEIDVTGKVVLPGFVDSHTHLVSAPGDFSDLQKPADEAGGRLPPELHRAMLDGVQKVRLAGSRTLSHQAQQWMEAFLRGGVTTLEARSGYGLDHTGELKSLRVAGRLDGVALDVISTYCGAHTIPPEYEDRPGEYIDWVIAERLPQVARRRLARYADVCCGRGAFSIDDARRYLDAARRLGLALKVQAEQFSHYGAARLAVEMGAASADHLQFVERDDIAVLAQSSTVATLAPGVSFHLGLGRYAPARALIDQGAAVALSTGFDPVTSPSCDMPMALALACARMRMTPSEAITAATINGAYAAGCADRAGSLETGKPADFAVFDVSDYREIPYHFGVSLVVKTVKRGVELYRRGEVRCPKS